jgi:putative NADPH-quinone reductase
LNISVILAHPDNQSFNHAIARIAVTQLQKNGHKVIRAVAPDHMGIRSVKLNLYRTTGGYSHVIEENAHRVRQAGSYHSRG